MTLTEASLNRLAALLALANDQGPFEARTGNCDLPTSPCRYAVVSRAKGVEICRVWEETEAALYNDLRNAAEELIRLARIGFRHDPGTEGQIASKTSL